MFSATEAATIGSSLDLLSLRATNLKVIYFAPMVKAPQPGQEEPRSKRHFPDWLKESLAIALVLLGFGGVVIKEYLPAKIDSQTKPMAELLVGLSTNVQNLRLDVQTLKADIDRIDKKIDGLLSDCLRRLTSSAAKERSDASRRKLELAQALVKSAKDNGIALDPGSLATVGRELISVRSKRPDLSGPAWRATVTLIEYRSYLDAKLRPAPPISGATTFVAASPDQILIHIHPGGSISGIVFQGGQAILDGAIVTNVIFRDMLVKFGPHPVTLENVYFENCRFQIPPTPGGIKLGEALLASNAPQVRLH